MKQVVSFDDGDLQYMAARLAEVLACVDRFRKALERVLALAPTMKITVLGFTLMTVEVKTNEHKIVSIK